MRKKFSSIAFLSFGATLFWSPAAALASPDRAVEEESVYDMPGITVTPHREGPFTGLSSHTLVMPVEAPGAGAGLRETLQHIPGLILQDGFGGFDPPRLTVRGSGIQSAPVSRGVRLSLNGFPLNFADGSFNLALIESGWLEYAALTPGPGAGVPSLGGSLALWSQGGLFSQKGSMETRYGSNRSFSYSTQAGFQSESTDSVFEGAISGTDGWRRLSEQRRESVLFATRTPVGESTEAVFQFFGSRPRFDVPGPLSKSEALNNPRSNFARVEMDRPRRETDYGQLGGRLTTGGAEGHVSMGVTAGYHRDDFFQLLPNGISTTRALEGALFADIHRKWDGDALPQETEAGLLLQGGRAEARRYQTDGGEKGLLIGDNPLRPLTLTVGLDHGLSPAETQTFAAGASVLAARRKIKAGAIQDESVLTLSDAKVAPRLFWEWTPLDGYALTLLWARSYEPPTFNDLLITQSPPPPGGVESIGLQWQRADSYEVRLRGETGPVSWMSGVYYAPWKRELLRLQDDDGNIGTMNADRTLHMGWESSLNWMLMQAADYQVRLWANYQLSDIRFDDDPIYGNNRLGGIPPHAGAAGLRSDLPGGWFVSPGLFWQAGKTYADHANTLYSGGFGVWSLDLGRIHPSGWEASLRLTNLFDRNYIAGTAGVLEEAAGPGQPIFLPGTGRRVEAALRYHW